LPDKQGKLLNEIFQKKHEALIFFQRHDKIFIIKAGDANMTKGQTEAKISEAVSKFEIEFMGRGPKQIRTLIVQDLIIIRLKGFLSQSEQMLVGNPQGVELLKKVRTMLFEGARASLEESIKKIVGMEVISTHSDVSTKTGEKIIVMALKENLGDRFGAE
jgi:uncharacterized protein YbcI